MEYVGFAWRSELYSLQFHVATMICVQVAKIVYDRLTATGTGTILDASTAMVMLSNGYLFNR